MKDNDHGYRDEAAALEWCRDNGATITPQFIYPFAAMGYQVSDGRREGRGATLAEAVRLMREQEACDQPGVSGERAR